VLALALALAAVATASALAAYGASTATRTRSVDPGSLRTSNARCAHGEESVAGGFKISGPVQSIRTVTSRRVSRRGWRSRADDRGAQPASLTAIAYCRVRHPRTPVVVGRANLTPQGVGKATATCPDGTTAVSGGFTAPHYQHANSAQQRIVASRRTSETEWTVQGINESPAFAGRIAAYAYCDPSATELTAASKEANVAPGAVKTIAATCPKGMKAVSGGFESDVSEAPLEANLATASKRSGSDSWENAVVNPGAAPHSLTSFVYCSV
jgi:hypothetical protein